MKRLLGKAADKDPSLHAIVPETLPERSNERLPWLSLASTLKLQRDTRNTISSARGDEKGASENRVEINPKEPEGPRPSPPANSPAHSARLNPPVHVKKGLQFQAYKATRPDLLSELAKMVADGLQEIASAHPHLFQEQTSPTKASPDHPATATAAQRLKAPALNARDEDASLYTAERLRVYAAAFQRFVDESTLYKHLLQQIKDTYDEYIVELLDKLTSFNSNVQQVSSREIDLAKQLADRDEVHAQRMSAMQQQRKDLEVRMAVLEMEKSRCEAESAKCRDMMTLMRKEYDEMKSTCLTLTNGLSRMEDEHRNYQNHEASRLSELTHLRASEQKSNEEIERLQQVVQTMEQHQSTMVSQEVVSALENTVDTLRGELKRLEATHRKLLNRYASLKAVVDNCFKKFESERSSTCELFHDNVRAKIAEIIDESVERRVGSNSKSQAATLDPCDKILLMMEHGAHPRLIVEVLLDNASSLPGRQRHNISAFLDADRDFASSASSATSEIAGSKVGTIAFENDDGSVAMAEEFRSPWSHFDGQGYTDAVPSFLKFHGKIQNLYLSKKEILRILEEIWEARIACDRHLLTTQSSLETPIVETSEAKKVLFSDNFMSSLPINPSMATFFENYLLDRFQKNRSLSIEMAYNIIDATKRFSAVSDCRLFTAVLEDKLPMEIWLDQRQLIDRIRDEIQKEIKVLKTNSGSSDASDDKKMTSEQMMRLLRRILPTKTDNAFSKLAKALAMDNQSGRLINTTEIFNEDDNGHRSHFLEQLKLQHINEAMTFEKHVIDCIVQFTDPGEKEMMVSKFREALNYADPNKSRADVNKLLARGCGTTIEEMLLLEAKRNLVNVEDFKKKLRTGLLQKSPPIPGKKS